MKPFNLERALAGDPVMTKDGRLVTQLVLFRNVSTSHPIFGVIHDEVFTWTMEGGCYVKTPSASDLLMAPVKREGWIIVRSPDENGIRKTSDMYPSPDVLYAHNPELIHCWIRKVEWEE